jgi:hypothetical protein
MTRRLFSWLATLGFVTACGGERARFGADSVPDAGSSSRDESRGTNAQHVSDADSAPPETDTGRGDTELDADVSAGSTSTTDAPAAATQASSAPVAPGPTATTTGDAGTDSNIEPPEPHCSSECASGDTRCAAGELSSCEQDAGCWVWGDTTSCASGQCENDNGCAGCTNECDAGSAQCAAGMSTQCESDAAGCFVWAETAQACPTGQCAEDGTCLQCADECTAGELRCADGVLQTCMDGDAGCTGWGAAESCSSCDAPTDVNALSPLRGSYSGSIHAPSALATLRPKLKWTAAEPTCGALTYELQMDDSCEPGRLDACAFESPEIDETLAANEFQPDTDLSVATAAPVGALYAWRVRACAYGSACSNWSNVSYLHVGRTAQDYDADGYADVVLNGSDETGYAVQIYKGSTNFNSGADVRLPFEYYVNSTSFGVRSAGDIDADGYADLVVVEYATDECSSSGSNIGVIYGGSDLTSPRVEHLCRTAGSPSVEFRVAPAGDLNGDGYADIAVARDLGSTENSIYVLAGGPSLSTTPVAEMDTNTGATYLHTATAGLSLAGGADFNADSYPDFMASSSGVTVHTVTQRLYLGGPQFATEFADDFTSDECRNNDYLTALGDVTDDGYADWALGCSGDSDYSFGLVVGGPSLGQSLTAIVHHDERMSGISPALDFDNDGVLDVFLGQSGPAFIWNDTGFAPATADNFEDLTDARIMAVADHDGDGRLDIASYNSTGSANWVGSYSSFNVVPVHLQLPADFAATNLGF